MSEKTSYLHVRDLPFDMWKSHYSAPEIGTFQIGGWKDEISFQNLRPKKKDTLSCQ